MSSSREPVTIVEIDFPYCANTYGVAPCTAVLGGVNVRKCYNCYKGCQDKPHYVPTVLTQRFTQPRSNLPRGATIFPVVSKLSEFSASVNIAGSDERMSALGERAEDNFTFNDFLWHDRGFDKYQAERVSGAAQIDEPGYDPQTRGTYFTKLIARIPYYYGSAVRKIEGVMVGSTFVEKRRSHSVLTELGIPDENNQVRVTAQDPLILATNEKAVVPLTNSGVLESDIDDTVTAFVLTPAGIGNLEYGTSGKGSIGSEAVSFTRSGDAVTITARGILGSKVASHKAGDTFQQAYVINNARMDDLVEDLLVNYAKINPAFIPKVTKWAPEVNRWASGVRMDSDILKPTGVSKVVGELANLGLIISWNERTQEIGFKMNRPVDKDVVHALSDETNIKKITAERYEDDRLSQVVFYTVQQDATKSLTDLANYNVVLNRADADAQGPLEYGTPKIRNVLVRFFNRSPNQNVSVLATRLLNRFRDPPTRYRITLDDKDSDIELADVLSVDTRKITDDTGKRVPTLLQVIQKISSKSGIEFDVVAQAFQYTGRYGFITENTRPDYPSSTAAQKANGAYFSNAGAAFGDAGTAYRFI